MPEPLIPWWQGLPQAGQTYGPDPAKMLNAQVLAEKLRGAQQERQGYNALANLFKDPSNLQNGMLTPEAQQRLGAAGYPRQMLEMMEAQSKIQQQRQATAMSQQKFSQAQNERSTEEMTPLLSQYDQDVGTIGKEAALQKYRTARMETIERMAGSGTYTPQFIETVKRNPGDPEALRGAILGPKSIQSPAEARDEVRKDERLSIEQNRAETPWRAQTIDGKPIDLVKGQAGNWINAMTREPVAANTLKPGSLTKIGTKTEEDASTAGTPTGPTDKHGAEYIEALPAARAAMIKGYAEGRVPFPGSFSLRSPYWQKMVADIVQYDPAFDAVNYNSRSSTRRSFTAGPDAANVTSLNTAIGHLGTLLKAGDKLNNTWSPLWNKVANFLVTQKGDPRVTGFNVAAQAVGSELTRAFRGTGGSLTEIEDWKKNLDTAGSPSQIHEAVEKAVDLLGSRISAVGEKYRRGMGTTADVTELLTPAARKTLAQLPKGEEILNDMGIRPQGTRGEPARTPRVDGAEPATPAAAAPPMGAQAPPAMVGGVPTYSSEEQFKANPPTGPWRRPDDPPGKVRMP